MHKLTIGQSVALGQHLSDYPENLSFNEIIFRIANNDLYNDDDDEMEICIQEYFTDWDYQCLTDHLKDIAESIDQRNLIAYGEIK